MEFNKTLSFYDLLPKQKEEALKKNELREMWNRQCLSTEDHRSAKTIERWLDELRDIGLAERFNKNEDPRAFWYHGVANPFEVFSRFMSLETAVRVLMASNLLQEGLAKGEVHELVAIAKRVVQTAPPVMKLWDAVLNLPPPEDQIRLQQHWLTLGIAKRERKLVTVKALAGDQVAIVSIFGLVTQGVHRYLIGGQNLGEAGVVRLDQVKVIKQELSPEWSPPDGFNLEQFTAGDWLKRVPSLFGNAGGQQ